MGLLSKFNFKDKFKQGLQGMKDYAYNNRDKIGRALQSGAELIKKDSPYLATALHVGGSLLQDVPTGPIKDELKKLSGGSINAQNAVNRRRNLAKKVVQNVVKQQRQTRRKQRR